MTPEEKAEQLVNDFINIPTLRDFNGMAKICAKECAITHINHILPLLRNYKDIVYWNNVKSAINNMSNV